MDPKPASSPSNAKGFCLVFLALALVAMAGTVAANLIVDPYWRFNLVSIDGFNAQHYAANSRLGKAGAVCRLQPSQIILGTSRAVVGLDPLHPGFNSVPGVVYNFAIAGSGLHEIDVNLRHAVHASKGLKRVIVALDFLMFNAHREVAAYGSEVLDFEEERLLVSDNDSCLRAFLYDANRLIGIRGLRSSHGSVVAQMHEPTTGNNPRLAEYISVVDPLGFQRRFSILDHVLAPDRGYRAMFGDAQEKYYTSKIWRAGPEQRYCFSRAGQPNTIDVFKGMVRFARSSGADVRFLINPIHARMLIAIREAGLWPQYEEWKRDLVKVLADEAAESGKPQLPLWDFSGFNSITTEHVPAPNDTTTIMRNFWEPSHYKKETGDLMLDRVLGYKDRQRAVPEDFGILLSPSNIESWLKSTRQGAASYAASEAAEVGIVKTIVDDVMSDANGANCGEDVEAARQGAALVAQGDAAGAADAFDRAVALHERDRKLSADLGVPYRERGFEKILAESRQGHTRTISAMRSASDR